MGIAFKTVFHGIAVVLTFGVAAWYFRAVAPTGLADLLAAVLALAELGSWLFTGRHGVSFRGLCTVALPLIVFPGAAWILRYATGWADDFTLPVAAAVACAVGTLGARHGAGGDTRRLAETGVAVLLPPYVLVRLTVAGAPPLALACGVAAVAVAPLVVRVTITWPGKHEKVLMYASAACGAWAAVVGAVALAAWL